MSDARCPMPSVLIIGAGIIGASIADALAQRGASVVVLDMRSPGRGASQASAGVLAPYIEAHEDSRLPVEYSKTGTLEVALGDDDAARLTASAAWLTRKAVAHEWIDAGRLRAF